jgi:hypothetical protein
LYPEKIKNSLLYWDKISYISTPEVHDSLGINFNFNIYNKKDYVEELRMLQQEDILKNYLLLTQTEINYVKKNGLNVPSFMGKVSIVAYEPRFIEGEIEGIGMLREGDITEVGNGVQVGKRMRVKELYTNILMMQAVLTQELNKRKDEFWSIGQTGNDFEMPLIQGVSKEIQLLELNFHNLLPFPASDTPIEKILKFKEKYRDELLTLQLALSKLNSKIENSQNNFRIIKDCKDEITIALNDLHRTLDESKIQKVFGVVKTLLDIKQIGSAPIIAGVVAHLADVPIFIGALTGYAVSGVISLLSKKDKKIEKLDSRIRDFVYLYYAKKELKK